MFSTFTLWSRAARSRTARTSRAALGVSLFLIFEPRLIFLLRGLGRPSWSFGLGWFSIQQLFGLLFDHLTHAETTWAVHTWWVEDFFGVTRTVSSHPSHQQLLVIIGKTYEALNDQFYNITHILEFTSRWTTSRLVIKRLCSPVITSMHSSTTLSMMMAWLISFVPKKYFRSYNLLNYNFLLRCERGITDFGPLNQVLHGSTETMNSC